MKGLVHNPQIELLEGVRNSDPIVINEIYRQILPGIIAYIRGNSGSEDDARDIFQEALIVLYRKVSAGNLELTCTLKTYLSSICRNLWLNRLRDHKEVGVIEGVEFIDPDEDLEHLMELTSRRRLFLKCFHQIGEKCKQVLELFFSKTPMKEIAKELETSESYIKKRKFACKEKLVSLIKNDPLFQELKT